MLPSGCPQATDSTKMTAAMAAIPAILRPAVSENRAEQ